MADRVLIVSILRADRSISGLALRFASLWAYFAQERPKAPVYLFCSESLRQRLWGQAELSSRLVSFEDRGSLYLLRRFWSVLKFLFVVVSRRIQTVHLAAGGSDFLVVLPILRLLGVRVCMTLAAAGLEVSTDAKAERRIHYFLRTAPNVDYLNHGIVAKLPPFAHKKFYSPCSFPHILALGHKPAPRPAAERQNWVVFCGSFWKHKNPMLAVEGFGRLLAREGAYPADACLLLFGDGPLRTEMKARADEINARAGRAAVRFEAEAELFGCLGQSRIFLSLQEPDNYPSQSLMEAMLYENSVVATDVGETRRIVPENGNALVPPDADAVADALGQLLAGPPCCPANATFILERHSPERFADYFLEVHRSLEK